MKVCRVLLYNGFMGIRFSEHSGEQIKRRGISNKQILEAVRTPEEILPSFRGRKLRRKRFGDKILEVVTMTEGSRITIITAYFLKEEK